MPVRHAIRRHGRLSRNDDHASIAENCAPLHTGGRADSVATLTSVQRAFWAVAVNGKSPIWCPEELALLRVLGVAVMLHVMIVGLVLFQAFVFGF